MKSMFYAGLLLAVFIAIGPLLSWRGLTDSLIAVEPAPKAVICEDLRSHGRVERPSYSGGLCSRIKQVGDSGGLSDRDIRVSISSTPLTLSHYSVSNLPPDLRTTANPCYGGDVSPIATTLDLEYILDMCTFTTKNGYTIEFMGLGRTFSVSAEFVSDAPVAIGQIEALRAYLEHTVTSMVRALEANVEYRDSLYTSPLTFTAQAILLAAVGWLGWRGVRDVREWQRLRMAVNDHQRIASRLVRWPAIFTAIVVSLGVSGVITPYHLTDYEEGFGARTTAAEFQLDVHVDAADDPLFSKPEVKVPAVHSACRTIAADLDIEMTDQKNQYCELRTQNGGYVRITWESVDPVTVTIDPEYRKFCTKQYDDIQVIDSIDTCVSKTDDDSYPQATFYLRSMSFVVDIHGISSEHDQDEQAQWAEEVLDMALPVIVTAIDNAP